MTLPDATHHGVQYVWHHDFQYCPECVEKTPDVVLRHWRFAWSLTCEICGQSLAAKHPAEAASDRLLARVARGAQALETAVVNKDLRGLRRIGLTLQVMSVLKIGHLWSLTSGSERERLLALAAVDVGTTRPLLGAAIILRGNDRGARELRRVFPQHRQVIERIRRLSQELDRRLLGQRETGHATAQETQGMSQPNASESALLAARQAIFELGPGANRQALLARADAIWKHSGGAKT